MTRAPRLILLPTAMVAAILAIPVAIIFAPAHQALRDAFNGEGYSRIVNELYVREGWIAAREERPGEAPADGKVVYLTPAFEGAPESAKHYYQASYLRGDLRADDSSRWIIDPRLMGIVARAHVIPSPFAAGSWRGRLDLRGGDETLAGLRSSSGEFIPLLSGAVGADGSRTAPLTLNAFTPLGAQPEPLRPAAMVKLTDQSGAPLAIVRMIGRRPYVEATGRWLYLDGATAHLEPGKGRLLFSSSTIRLRDAATNREARFTFESEVAPAVTWPQALGERGRRPEHERLARVFENAMDEAVHRCKATCRALSTSDYTLTLDRDLHAQAQDALDRQVKGSTYPATVTIMDALSGEILALADYDPEAPGGPLAAGPVAAARRPVNLNFEPYSVGSAAKPPVAAAILSEQARPGRSLGDLVMANQAEGGFMRSLMGVSLLQNPRDVGLNVGDRDPAEIDFDAFLRVSSNQYAAGLMLLSAEQRGPVSGQPKVPTAGAYWLKGKSPPAYLPPLSIDFVRTKEGYAFDSMLGAPPWSQRFREIFETGREAPLGDGVSDLGIWASVVDKAPDRRMPALREASPTLQDWRFDAVRNFRTDYLPIILGGDNYRWSTVKLAESYARLVTGQHVRSRFVASNAPPSPEAIDGYPSDVRGRMCTAMESVLQGTAGGTAPFVERLRDGTVRWIGFYSKTGTGEVDEFSPGLRAQLAAENRLLALNHVRRGPDGAALGVYDRRGRPIAEPLTADNLDRAIRGLSGDPQAREALRGASARIAVQRALRFNRARPEDAARLYNVGALGTLRSVAAPVPDDRRKTHSFVFVAAVYGAGSPVNCANATPVAAYAVAINVQDEDREAQAIARELLDPNGAFGRLVRGVAGAQSAGVEP